MAFESCDLPVHHFFFVIAVAFIAGYFKKYIHCVSGKNMPPHIFDYNLNKNCLSTIIFDTLITRSLASSSINWNDA